LKDIDLNTFDRKVGIGHGLTKAFGINALNHFKAFFFLRTGQAAKSFVLIAFCKIQSPLPSLLKTH
jgi:hypothetical protein